jgi:hypothetical protein
MHKQNWSLLTDDSQMQAREYCWMANQDLQSGTAEGFARATRYRHNCLSLLWIPKFKIVGYAS